MKRIGLRIVADERFAPGTPEHAANLIDWREIIRQVLRRPLDPQRGAEVTELRKSIRVLDAMDKAADVLVLEDADWEHLREKTLAMQWAIVDKRIVDFIDDVVGATENGIAKGMT